MDGDETVGKKGVKRTRPGGYPGSEKITFHMGEVKRSLVIVPYVKGLVKEGRRVKGIMKKTGPEIIFLNISPEEMEGLVKYMGGGGEVVEPASVSDSVYFSVLSQYGEVSFPSPALTSALEFAREKKVPIKPLDMTEEMFTEVYLKHVGYLSHLRKERTMKRILRMALPRDDPVETLLIIDSEITKQRGYREVEAARVSWQVERALECMKEAVKGALLQEVERVEETIHLLLKQLREGGMEPKVSLIPQPSPPQKE